MGAYVLQLEWTLRSEGLDVAFRWLGSAGKGQHSRHASPLLLEQCLVPAVVAVMPAAALAGQPEAQASCETWWFGGH